MDLDSATRALRERGAKGTLVEHKGSFCWRATVSDASGTRKQRRINLGVPAVPGQLLSAESRVIRLAEEIARSGILPDPLPWASEITKSAESVPAVFTVQAAVDRLKVDFWQGKIRTTAAERTWERVEAELKRLPAQATLSIELLVAVASTTKPGSRSRQEACKVFKRLAKVAGLTDLDQIDAIRTPYEPAERELPTDAQLVELLERVGSHPKYGWMTWALATYGCRPSEVFSLQPADDGTARVLSIKRKGKLPTWRTAMALPVVAAPGPRSVVWDVNAPAKYCSMEAKRITQTWGVWLKSNAPGLQLYDLRHCWAIRSIRQAVPTGLAAKCMGHDIAVHSRTYHRWLDQADVAAFIAARSSQ